MATRHREPTTGRRVGDLASAAGLTVRTLHYYEEIGLLEPSARNAAGHRLYSDADVERLYRICFLRRLGLPLDEVARVLDDDGSSITTAISRHLAHIDERVDALTRLRSILVRLLDRMATDGRPVTDDLLSLMEEMNMLEIAVQRRIAILVYADLEAACRFLTRVFGLAERRITRDEAGNPVHVELHAGDGVVWLHKESADFGLASPKSLGAATSCTAVMVDDVDAHYRHAVAEGAQVEYEPVDQPYGYREYSARDCEGGLWSFMKPLE